MIRYVSQWQVKSDELEEATAEMISACGKFKPGYGMHTRKSSNNRQHTLWAPHSMHPNRLVSASIKW